EVVRGRDVVLALLALAEREAVHARGVAHVDVARAAVGVDARQAARGVHDELAGRCRAQIAGAEHDPRADDAHVEIPRREALGDLAAPELRAAVGEVDAPRLVRRALVAEAPRLGPAERDDARRVDDRLDADLARG